MLFEALYHLLNLDIPFFIDWIAGSIFLLFGIYVVMHFFSNGKHVLRNTILFIISAFAWIQFQDLSGFIFMTGAFLTIVYISKLVFIKFAENTPALQNKLVFINEISFAVLLVIYTLGWFG